MPWIGGVLGVRDSRVHPDSQVLPNIFETERECAAEVALLLNEMGLLMFGDCTDEHWIVPADWERASKDPDFPDFEKEEVPARYNWQLMPSPPDVRNILSQHVTSAELLRWLCVSFHCCDKFNYARTSNDDLNWRFFVQEL